MTEGVISSLIATFILWLVGTIFGSWSWQRFIGHYGLNTWWGWLSALVWLGIVFQLGFVGIEETFNTEYTGVERLGFGFATAVGWLAVIYALLAPGFGWCRGAGFGSA